MERVCLCDGPFCVKKFLSSAPIFGVCNSQNVDYCNALRGKRRGEITYTKVIFLFLFLLINSYCIKDIGQGPSG